MSTKTTHPAYSDDDPRIVVALRRATEGNNRPWNVFVTGCAVESVFLMLVVLSEVGFSAVTRQPPDRPKPERATLLYIPPVRKMPTNRPPPVTAMAKRRVPRTLEDPALQPSKIKVDMSAIEISVVDDVANEIPAVVRQQNGELALLETGDPSFARYTFEPPDWRMHEGIVDVSRRMRFTMTPSSRWPLLQTLATSNGIQMERYQVNALFSGAFSACLEREIRDHASAPAGSGKVRAVVIAFNSSRSCGIDVVNIDYAPVH